MQIHAFGCKDRDEGSVTKCAVLAEVYLLKVYHWILLLIIFLPSYISQNQRKEDKQQVLIPVTQQEPQLRFFLAA